MYRIDSDLVSTLLINAAPTQVTAFTAGPNGRLFAASGNVGKVYQVGPETQKSGKYESEPLDAQYFSYWGRVRYKGEANQGTVGIETRSGNLDRPTKNWSPWARVNETGRIVSPSARFLQSGSPSTAAPRVVHPSCVSSRLRIWPRTWLLRWTRSKSLLPITGFPRRHSRGLVDE